MERQILSIKNKALSLNLDPTIYGTIAEIGGGQEVARAFFQAGGASGTVAKSISAYDRTFSDHLYNSGKSGRYVSENRLAKMLGIEYKDLINTLQNSARKGTRFFAFADTVVTLNYAKDNDAHGWLGVKFQLHPNSEPSEVSLHVSLLENDKLLQQYTLGSLGVNLIYACYHFADRPNVFLKSLMDNLDSDRVEINMVRMGGHDLSYVDNRLLGVQLVKNQMTSATIFDSNGEVQQPADMLYRKNLLAFRGSFRPITNVGYDMLQKCNGIFRKDEDYRKDNTLAICEITLNNLMHEGVFDETDFLERVNLLNGLGQNVMISNFREYYKLVSYFSKFRLGKLRVVIGIPTFIKVWDKKYYSDLRGGILEAFGKLFTGNMKLYVYPSLNKSTGKLFTSKDIELPADLKHLYHYLCENKKIIDVKSAEMKWLMADSSRTLGMIQNDTDGWEELVPGFVAEYIKKNKIFGFTGKGT
ncbi:MAG: TonB-dependent receptor [Marinilabiliales bacterium]|nr:MAG: TonB-dependent receptor [Marinilabiliales bacterium]